MSKTLLDELAMAALPATLAFVGDGMDTENGVNSAVEAAYGIAAHALEVRKAYPVSGHIDPELERRAERWRIAAGLQPGPRMDDETR